MKFFLILSLALIFPAHFVSAQSEYTTLSNEEAASEEAPLETLKYIGWKFVLEKGIFQSTKFPLDNGIWNILSTEKTEKRTTDDVTYYRFTVQLGLIQGQLGVIEARYVISYRHSNGKILISSWSYSLVQGPETEETGTGGPTFIDIRSINDGTSQVALLIDDAFESSFTDAIEQGLLPDSDYDWKYVYSCEDSGEFPPNYTFLLSFASSDGKYYLLEMSITDESVLGNSEEEGPEAFPTYKINPVYTY